MKKLIALLLIVSSFTFASSTAPKGTWVCQLSHVTDINSGKTQYVDKFYTVVIVTTGSHVEVYPDDKYSYGYEYQKSGVTDDNVPYKKYSTRTGSEVIGIYDNFKSGFRSVNSNTVLNFVNCIKK